MVMVKDLRCGVKLWCSEFCRCVASGCHGEDLLVKGSVFGVVGLQGVKIWEGGN